MLKILRQYWPTMLVVLVIGYATFASAPVLADEMPAIPHIDKLIHAVMMGGLLSAFAFDWQRAHRDLRLTPSFLWAVFGAVVAFSVFDEVVQNAIDNGRSGDVIDFLADAVGAAVAAWAAPPVIRRVLGLKKSEQKA